MVQVNYGKAMTRMSAYGIVLLPIYVVMTKATLSFWCIFIDKGISSMKFSPVKKHSDRCLDANRNRNHTKQNNVVCSKTILRLHHKLLRKKQNRRRSSVLFNKN